MLASRARAAMRERLGLVCESLDVQDVVEISRPEEVAQLGHKVLHYLIDANQATCIAGAWLSAKRVPFVLDTGDDPASLARNNGVRTAALRGWAAGRLAAHALGVVHRGFFHGPVLRSVTHAPLLFVPDTVPDVLIDRTPVPAVEPMVASFGSASAPTSGDRAYGWEVLDALAASPDLRGVLVVRGPGIEALRARALRLGVGGRVAIHPPSDLNGLVELVQPASIVTSIQTDDLAGWVRTTGKLPLALGMGKMVAASAVGQATRALPEQFLLPRDDTELAIRIGALAVDCVGLRSAQAAKALAEPFRRSTNTTALRGFVAGLST